MLTKPSPGVVLVFVAAVLGLYFTGTSTYDFAQYLDRQVHGLHCSFLPGVGGVDVSGESGCFVTLMSPYSSIMRKALWGGIPISLAGMGTFALVLFRAAELLIRGRQQDPVALRTLLLLTLVPVGASLVMGVIALQVLDAACKLCIGTYAASALCFVGALWAVLSGRRSGFAALAEEDEEQPHDAAPLLRPGPAFAALVIQIGLFNLIPLAAWAVMAPAHGDYAGTCGELIDPSDKYDVLLPVGTRSASSGSTGVPALEVLDPLCPSCKAFEERIIASGQADAMDRRIVLFPLDAECNWMVGSSLHPGACTISEAVLCADERAEEVLAWAFENQSEVRSRSAEDPAAAAAMVSAAFPEVARCIGKPAVQARLNQSLRWAVKNQLPVLTPQLFVGGQRVCDADTDLGLDHTLARLLADAASSTEASP